MCVSALVANKRIYNQGGKGGTCRGGAEDMSWSLNFTMCGFKAHFLGKRLRPLDLIPFIGFAHKYHL